MSRVGGPGVKVMVKKFLIILNHLSSRGSILKTIRRNIVPCILWKAMLPREAFFDGVGRDGYIKYLFAPIIKRKWMVLVMYKLHIYCMNNTFIRHNIYNRCNMYNTFHSNPLWTDVERK